MIQIIKLHPQFFQVDKHVVAGNSFYEFKACNTELSKIKNKEYNDVDATFDSAIESIKIVGNLGYICSTTLIQPSDDNNISTSIIEYMKYELKHEVNTLEEKYKSDPYHMDIYDIILPVVDCFLKNTKISMDSNFHTKYDHPGKLNTWLNLYYRIKLGMNKFSNNHPNYLISDRSILFYIKKLIEAHSMVKNENSQKNST